MAKEVGVACLLFLSSSFEEEENWRVVEREDWREVLLTRLERASPEER